MTKKHKVQITRIELIQSQQCSPATPFDSQTTDNIDNMKIHTLTPLDINRVTTSWSCSKIVPPPRHPASYSRMCSLKRKSHRSLQPELDNKLIMSEYRLERQTLNQLVKLWPFWPNQYAVSKDLIIPLFNVHRAQQLTTVRHILSRHTQDGPQQDPNSTRTVPSCRTGQPEPRCKF